MNHKNIVQKLQLLEKAIKDIKSLPEDVDPYQYLKRIFPYVDWDVFKNSSSSMETKDVRVKGKDG